MKTRRAQRPLRLSEHSMKTGLRPTLAIVSLLFVSPLLAQDAPGLGDPGVLERVEIVSGRPEGEPITIAGKDAGQQLVVVGHYSTGQVRDLTRTASYAVEPADLATVDSTGFVFPVSEGDGTITVTADGNLADQVALNVSHIVVDPPINFPNQITPIFTKFGCNGGGCHGKSGGQNGFALSLLGFEPQEDFEYLVKEGRGRRVFPASPDRSLLLTKAIAKVPHGGGQRIEEDSPAYRLLRRWIAQGMPYGDDDDPQVVRIAVHPRERVMPRNGEQQLTVIAHYSNGATEDVTRMTTFESNDTEMGDVNRTGMVTATELTGSVAVMARYQGHVECFAPLCHWASRSVPCRHKRTTSISMCLRIWNGWACRRRRFVTIPHSCDG